MNRSGHFLALLALLVAGCSTERYEGGFETSDLSARVLTPSGAPAVGAQVWLVRGQGITAPATVLDSTRTDSSGLAKFTVAKSTDRNSLGLDGQLGHLLAISPTPLLRSDSARLSLAPTESVSIGAESNGEIPRLFVPGSHFLSKVSATGRAVLSLPKGSWTVAKTLLSGTRLLSSVLVDSAPVPLDTLPTMPIDTSDNTPLAIGPDFALDSFVVDSTPMFLDKTFPLPVSWTRDDGIVGNAEIIAALVSDYTGIVALATAPKTGQQGSLSNLTQGGAGIRTPLLPPSGCIALRFQYPFDPVQDTALLRQFRFSDSGGVQTSLRLARFDRLDNDSQFLAHGTSNVRFRRIASDTLRTLRATTWYISWNPTAIHFLAQDSVFHGRVDNSFGFRGLVFHLGAGTYFPGTSSQFKLVSARLYKPR